MRSKRSTAEKFFFRELPRDEFSAFNDSELKIAQPRTLLEKTLRNGDLFDDAVWENGGVKPKPASCVNGGAVFSAGYSRAIHI